MISDSQRKYALLGSAGTIVLLLACLASIGLYKQAVPPFVEANTKNVTSADYEAAFQKWQESGIENYEITIHSRNDDVTLRVTDGGASVVVVRHLLDGQPIVEEDMDSHSTGLRNMTVQRMFDMVQGSVAAHETDSLPQSDDEGRSIFYDLNVRFDPTLGYPVYIAQHRRVTRPSHEITWREVSLIPIEVKNFVVTEGR
ncbi:MAG: DUF6174 domain-containing protein [Chloroflexota bacterium]|nr:DUF6174 domain-containing protein [Chloroflexota bacterium]MDQ5864925.1 DUF6174 domain-containing protein [Chloroflexota bacterium]